MSNIKKQTPRPAKSEAGPALKKWKSSGLLEHWNLRIGAGLTDLEVLHDKVTADVQLTVGSREIGQLLHGVVVALSILNEILVCRGRLLGLLNDLLGLVLNGGIAVLDINLFSGKT